MRKLFPLMLLLMTGLVALPCFAAGEALYAPKGLPLDATQAEFAEAVYALYGVEVEKETLGGSTILTTPNGAISEGFEHPVTIRAVYDEPDTMAYLQCVYERQANGFFFDVEPDDTRQNALFVQAVDLYMQTLDDLGERYGEPTHGLFAATSAGHEGERYYDYPMGDDTKETILRAMEVEDTVYLANYRSNVSAYLHMWRFQKEEVSKLMLDLRVTYAQEPHAKDASQGAFTGKNGPYSR